MFGNAGMSPSKGIRDTRMRMGRGMDDDDEDDDDEDGPREAVAQPSFKKDDISLDQARRIATQSIFRAGRLG